MRRILSRRNGRAKQGHGLGLVPALTSGGAAAARRRCRPGILALEGRRLLSTFYVTSTADDGSAGTLRSVISAASQAGVSNTIDFNLPNPGTPQTITLSQGALVLGGSANLTIQGPGAGLLTIDAAKSSRVFQVNLGVTASISGLTITGGTGTAGGGVYSKGNTSLSDCVVTGNTATNYGGGIYGSNTLSLTDCTISANSGFMGGGVYTSVKVATTPTITDCTISGNSAGQNGAGAYLGGTAAMTDCTISGNSAAKYGGGLWTDGATTLTGCTISGNSAVKYGGGLCVYHGSPTLDACTISGNSSGTYGGGLFNFRKVASSLTDCTITGNTASHGGGLFNYGGTPTLMSCTIADNLAITSYGGLDNYYSAIYKGKISLTNTIVAGNNQGTTTPTASDIGGNGASGVTGTYNLIGTGGSGGIANGSSGNVVLSSLATLGLAPLADYGGPTPTLALLPGSAAIGAGTSTGAPSTDQRGFALDSPIDIGAFQYASASPPVVTSATDGSATPSGSLNLRGALDLAGLQSGSVAISFSSSAFASATTIALSAGPLADTSTSATISIAGPSAGLTISGGNGGVIAVGSGANLSISDLTISGGSATLGGGVDNSGTLTLTACTITDGRATTGGGLYNKGTMTLVECTVAANSAAQGGAIANAGTLTLTASTISGNSAGTGGGGLYQSSAGSGATVNDTIVAGNLGTGGAADDIKGAGASNVTGSSSLIGTGGSGGIANGANGDIVLSSLATLGLSALGSYGGTTETFAILPGSAAIAAGNSTLLPSGVTTDQRGEPRTVNATMDIGAFESQGFTMTAISGSTPQAVLAGSAFTALGVTVTANNSIEPVAGGTVAFAVTAATDGASATLGSGSAIIGSGGTATVAATANSTGGVYSVSASTAGVSSGVTFDLTNQVQPAFSGLSAPTMTYGTASVQVSGTIAAGSQIPATQSVSIALDGVNQSATIGSDGSFSTTFTGLGTLSVSGSPYTISYSYTSDGTFLGASQSTSLTVNPATPTVSVSDSGGTYNGSAFDATDSVAGLSGVGASTLEGVGLTLTYYTGSTATGTPLSGAPSTAGTYTVVAAFAGSTDYTSGSAQTTFTITQATPTVTVTDAGGTYSGSPFAATDSIQGVSGPAGSTLEGVGLTITYYAGTTASGTP
ncbi:MAG: beta strand repeat-containing protein, partial [Isosphaeraceae bacterium]